MNPPDRFAIAAIQASPVFLDLARSVDKACALIAEAGRRGASLAVFPEGFLPGYPLWTWFIPPGHTQPLRELYALLHANAVTVPGPETERLGRAAREAGVATAIAVSERNVEGSGGSLHNTLLYFDAQGALRGKHRKLVPTGGERLVWAPGDASGLAVHDLGVAKVGGLLCWENYMPLARYALGAQGEEIHVAPTWDRGEPWLSTMRHLAKESRCFVVGCGSPLRREDIPDRLAFKAEYLAGKEGWLNAGDSVIVDPDGKVVAGPAHEEEVILVAEVRREQLAGPRWQIDTAGHYARPDIFDLRVDRRPRTMLTERRGDDENR